MKIFWLIVLFFKVNILLFSQNADDITGYWYATFPEEKSTPVVIEIF